MKAWKNPDGHWDFDTFIAASKIKPPLTNLSNSPNFGYSTKVLWTTLKINNQTNLQRHWLAEILFTGMDRVDLFYQQPDGTWVHKYAGRNLPMSMRDNYFRNTSFNLQLPQGTTQLYWRFENAGTIAIPVTISTQSEFYLQGLIDTALKSSFFGFMVAMIIYNLFIALSIREPGYIYYVLFQIAMTATIYIENGYALMTIWPEAPIQDAVDFNFAIMLSLFFPVLFFTAYINTSKMAPTLHKALVAYALLQLANSLTLPFIPIEYSLRLHLLILSAQINYLFLLAAGVTMIAKGSREARYFVAAWLAIVCSMLTKTLWHEGLISFNTLTSNLDEFFIIFEASVLSIGLAHGIKVARSEKQNIEEELINSQLETIEALENTDNLKDEFIAHVSHELRTPIASMSGMADQILSEESTSISNDSVNKLNIIKSSGHRLSHLINDIIDIAAVKRGQLSLKPEPVNLAQLSHMACQLAEPLVGNKDITIINNTRHHLPSVYADERRIYQVLFNLITNAIKFTDQGKVTITAQQQNNHICLSVTDTGVGIARSDQERIFKNFEQGDNDQVGSGLGLAISKKLIELHGHNLYVDSEPGSGACFTFMLDIYQHKNGATKDINASEYSPLSRAATPANAPPTLDFSPDKATILIIDDEHTNLEVLNGYLCRHFNLLLADSAQQGLELLKNNRVSLILLDVMMPKVSGLELCQQLRKQHSAQKLPIIILSAKQTPLDITQGFAVGANDYITKPFYRDELFARIQAQLTQLSLIELQAENNHLKIKIESTPEGNDDDRQHYRTAIVELMHQANDLWVQTTNLTTIDLAEKSGIWRASLDGSRMRARTMERYFDINNLPKNPRWRDVANTAHFVLANANMSTEERSQLSQAVDQLITLKRANRSNKKTYQPPSA
ncbi:hybrid sensor histidine kinase/response regulator [Sinobacterium norvegicum]|nr:hybrid sensor histidine kinase/response regulator [Sinobacterium norvegicum]